MRKRLPYLAFAVVGVAFVGSDAAEPRERREGIDVAAKSLDLGLVAYVFLAAMAAISAMVLPAYRAPPLLLIFGLYSAHHGCGARDDGASICPTRLF